jgi:hypothetical protein
MQGAPGSGRFLSESRRLKPNVSLAADPLGASPHGLENPLLIFGPVHLSMALTQIETSQKAESDETYAEQNDSGGLRDGWFLPVYCQAVQDIGVFWLSF